MCETYLIYASECNTLWGLGGTVMNNGSAGGVAITIIKIYENFRLIIQLISIIFIMQIIIKITSLKTNKKIK